ncbi:cytochrome P450 [Georgenia sp. AZ-5]|uniref:cytochrome P450 n=1 Tax=Georgenia sp. AZ-5 TaxID=3367526 RepID=UPI003753EE45
MTQTDFVLGDINSNFDADRAYEAARAENGPVFRTNDLQGYVAVLSYEHVRQGAANHSGLCSGQGATIPPLGVARAIPTETDLPEHREYRRIIQPELRPDRIKDWEGRIREVADEAIDDMIEAGKGDLRHLAERVPAVIIAEILGAPDRAQEMLDISDRLNRAAGSDKDEAIAAKQAFSAFIDELVSTAEADPEYPGLLGLITRAEIDGKRLDHEQLVRLGISLVLAGHETTVNGISSMLWLIGAHPEVKERLIADPQLIPRALEEALRRESPVTMMGRTATEKVELGGITIEPGEKVGLNFGAANLDPAKYPNPGVFDIDREAKSHLAFGHGIHRCIGEYLARAEMRIAAERVLARMPDYQIDGEVQVGANIAMNRGLVSLPVVFTPGAKVGADRLEELRG